jgi:oxygen-independent coproporphyrinogen-3 oxidase
LLLYIHIPFCDSKCHYCSFNSFTKNHHLKNSYINALLQQLKFDIENFNVQNFETIFIGGGTPSTLPIYLYEKIFNMLSPYLKNTKEITIEANPTAKKEWIKEIKNFTNRISFGVQSFDEEKLRFLGRNHTPKEAIKAIEEALKSGFKRVNLDLIYNCKIDTKKLLKRDIDMACNLNIEHISAYSLTQEENTPFFNQDVTHRYEFGYFIKELIEEKLSQYEVSNFGDPSLHNLGYWQLKNYIGAGCGAVGFFNNQRYYPYKDIFEYIKNPLFKNREKLSFKDIKTEKIFLGLRSKIGVDMKIVDSKKAKMLQEEQKVYIKNSRLFNKNYFLADEIALFLMD